MQVALPWAYLLAGRQCLECVRGGSWTGVGSRTVRRGDHPIAVETPEDLGEGSPGQREGPTGKAREN